MLGTGDYTLKFGDFALGGIGTATFGAIVLWALLGRKTGHQSGQIAHNVAMTSTIPRPLRAAATLSPARPPSARRGTAAVHALVAGVAAQPAGVESWLSPARWATLPSH